MYQFYYADEKVKVERGMIERNLLNEYKVTKVRPSMWEEHCLECSAPLCFENCAYFEPRSDGRCKRFENGCLVFEDARACCGQGVHIRFRKWANMMTIIFPEMMTIDEYKRLVEKNQILGNRLHKILSSKLPTKVRWWFIRIVEYIRRNRLRRGKGMTEEPDAFVFHGFSYEKKQYKLIVEVFNDSTPEYRMSFDMYPGENLYIVDKNKMSSACWKNNYLVKIYPENNIEAELDILWCDFVQGSRIVAEQPDSKVKCVVWDLDNTLWNGILIETNNPETLQLRDGVFATIKELDRRGILQSVASKNDFKQAWDNLQKLGVSEYFLYPQIHWGAKSGSIKQIAECLNIGVDTFALIDDSIFEREQVHSILPQVRVYRETEVPGLLNLPEFSVLVTEESKVRRLMYKAEEKRNQFKMAENSDTVDFLRKCHLKVTLFEPKTDSEILRCFELVVRTNQLNMSGKKYSTEEFAEVCNKPNHNNVAFSCSDDFGEYGIVGFAQYRIENATLVFTEFAMACRVAGKFVECSFFAFLLKEEACTSGIFTVVKTKKNILLRNTLESIGFARKDESAECISYTFNDDLKNCKVVETKGRK